MAAAIVSASRRTDLPALYGDWLLARLRAGYALVANPFNPRQVRRVDLAPERVGALVLWTKNPAPFLGHLPELEQRGHRFYFQHTLNHYPGFLEPGLPSIERRLESFRRLAEAVGPERVRWRYDPVVLSSATPAAYHHDMLAWLGGELAGACRRVTVSLLTWYQKVRPRLAREAAARGVELRDPAEPGREEELAGLAAGLAEAAAARGLEIRSCASPELAALGIAPGACVDAGLVSRLWGVEGPPGTDPHQRPACGCAPSVDIGAYDTCGHGCLYCYANAAPQRVRANQARHRIEGEALLPLAGAEPPG
jgi:hypothetical protein